MHCSEDSSFTISALDPAWMDRLCLSPFPTFSCRFVCHAGKCQAPNFLRQLAMLNPIKAWAMTAFKIPCSNLSKYTFPMWHLIHTVPLMMSQSKGEMLLTVPLLAQPFMAPTHPIEADLDFPFRFPTSGHLLPQKRSVVSPGSSQVSTCKCCSCPPLGDLSRNTGNFKTLARRK